jgi:hypothetical protein
LYRPHVHLTRSVLLRSEKPGKCEEMESQLCRPDFGIIEISPVQMSEVGSTQYEPLDYSKQSIRLLYLVPGNPNCEIRCNTKHYLASFCPDYAAVSYTWGDPNVTRQIWLNDKPFLVRQNLWDLLHQFRNDKTALVLWIDAICINQDNIRERNHQVNLMSVIYQNAECVLVWLGTARDNSDIAIAYLKISSRYFRDSGLYIWNRPQRYKGDIAEEVALVLEEQPSSEVIREHGEVAVVKLLGREYWQRAWIVQEILLAKQIDIWCGEAVIQWDTLQLSILNMRSKLIDTRINVKNDGGSTMVLGSLTKELNPSHFNSGIVESAVFRLCEQRRHRISKSFFGLTLSTRDENIHEELTLAELILQNVHVLCTDPRDKVYAFLGLASDCTNGAGICADYSTSPVQLYIDVVCFCDPTKAGLQFIEALQDMLRITSIEVGHFVRNRRSAFLPSSIDQLEVEMVKLRAAHMGIISNVFSNWFADNNVSVSEARRFLKLTVGDLSPSTIDKVFELDSLRAFLPELCNTNQVIMGSKSQPALILTGRRATHRVGFACSGTMIGDLVCQFVDTESAIIVRKAKESYTIVGKATMIKQGLLEEKATNSRTRKPFAFSALSRDGLEKTTQLTWRLHPLDLVGFGSLNHHGFRVSMIRPPSRVEPSSACSDFLWHARDRELPGQDPTKRQFLVGPDCSATLNILSLSVLS